MSAVGVSAAAVGVLFVENVLEGKNGGDPIPSLFIGGLAVFAFSLMPKQFGVPLAWLFLISVLLFHAGKFWSFVPQPPKKGN